MHNRILIYCKNKAIREDLITMLSDLPLTIIDKERELSLLEERQSLLFLTDSPMVCKKISPTIPYVIIGDTEKSGEKGKEITGEILNYPFQESASRKRILTCYTLLAERERINLRESTENLEMLAARIARDFHDTLGGIRSASSLLQNEIMNNPKAREYNMYIQKAARQAEEWIEKLQVFSGTDLVTPSPLAPEEIVLHAAAFLEETVKPDKTVTCLLNGKDLKLLGSEPAFEQTLITIGLHAVLAVPSGEELIIRTGSRELDAAFCRSCFFPLRPGPYYTITYESSEGDTNAEDRLKKYDPFRPMGNHPDETDMDLISAFLQITRMKGTMDRSTPTEGKRVYTLYFPVHSEKAPDEQEDVQEKESSAANILIVDDEPVLLKMLTDLFIRQGFSVSNAENGKNALFKIKKQPERYDLIIMDMIMPEMTGIDSYDAIKSIRPDIKVLFMSGYFNLRNLKEIEESETTGFIKKPFKLEEIVRRVREML